MQWGTITWFFLHTFSEKINEDFFTNNREHIIDLTINLFNVLPCPKCIDHAKNTVKQFNLNYIQKKEQYKEFLFQFHNKVNIITRKPTQFTMEEYNQKYKLAKFEEIIQLFRMIMNKDYSNQRNLTTGMYRKKVIHDFASFIRHNWQNFRWD
jgi:hypothetical protein